MERAYHLPATGVETEYQYFEFALLPDDERARLKSDLRCCKCHSPANFRASGSDGRRPTFYLRKGESHGPDCGKILRTSGSKADEQLAITEVETVKHINGVFDLTAGPICEYLDEESFSGSQLGTSTNSMSQQSTIRKHVKVSERTRLSSASLLTLLKYCLRASGFIEDPVFEVKYGGRTYNVNEKFVNFFQVNEVHTSGKPHFFWGVIKGAKIERGILFAGANERMQLWINRGLKDKLYNALKVNKFWQVRHAYVICFGWLKRDDPKKPYYLYINHMRDVAFLNIKPNPGFIPFEPSLQKRGEEKEEEDEADLKKWDLAAAPAVRQDQTRAREQRPAAPDLEAYRSNVNNKNGEKLMSNKGVLSRLWGVITGKKD